MTPEQENQMLEEYYSNHWAKLARGVRVGGDTVILTVKGGNHEARCLCSELINELEMNTDANPKE